MTSKLHQWLDVKHALVQAPMAGGPTTPALVAAVSAAGALGSFGFAYTTPEQIHAQCQTLLEQTKGQEVRWNANFFIFPPSKEPGAENVTLAKTTLEPFGQRLGIDTNEFSHLTSLPNLTDQVAAALTYHPALVSFHFGVPAQSIIDEIQETGCKVAVTATSLAEAQTIKASGVDFIVAQGLEAGGHRGVFDPKFDAVKLSTLELVTQLVSGVDLPVIAAGGIMTGADIAILRQAGADAVQLGSAFLTVDECGLCDLYREALTKFKNRPTELTTGFSGRPARGISNQFIETMASSEHNRLPFPWQNTLTGAMRKAAGAKQDLELMSLWAGENYGQARNCSAAELIESLEQQAKLA